MSELTRNLLSLREDIKSGAYDEDGGTDAVRKRLRVILDEDAAADPFDAVEDVAVDVMQGAFDASGGEERLRNQLIRIARGAPYERLTVDAAPAANAAGSVETTTTQMPSGPCSLRGQHAKCAREKRACPECGENKWMEA